MQQSKVRVCERKKGQNMRRYEQEERLSGLNTSVLLGSPRVGQMYRKGIKRRGRYRSVQQFKTT